MSDEGSAKHAAPRASAADILVPTAIVLGLAAAGLLIPVPFHGRLAVAIGDLAHAPLFGGVTLVVLVLLDRLRPLGDGAPVILRSMAVAGGMFLFGVLMELLQDRLGRDGAVHDAVANGLGIGAALAWYGAGMFARQVPARRHVRRGLLLAAGMLLAAAWWSPMTIVKDVAAVRWRFPMLASFESKAELQRFHRRGCSGRRTREDATDGRYAYEITYRPSDYPAATLFEMVNDWSAMKSLEMDVSLDQGAGPEPVEFMVKVIDSHHEGEHSDTFRKAFTLQPGAAQHLRITRDELISGPDQRQLDLSSVMLVDLMLLFPQKATTLRIDAIRLTLAE